MTRWHIVFTGRVQHVGFRYTAYYFARQLFVTGWVDNLPDGRVEMEAQGSAIQLQKFLAKLKTQFRIERMDLTRIEPLPFDRKFQVRGYD